MADFTRFWKNKKKKKKNYQNGKFGSVAPVKQFLFFCGLINNLQSLKPGGVLNFELGTNVQPEISTTTL